MPLTFVATPPKAAKPPARYVAPKVHPHHVADSYRRPLALAYARAVHTLVPDLDALTRGISTGVTASAMSSLRELGSFQHRLGAEMLQPIEAIVAIRAKEAADKLTPVAIAKAVGYQPQLTGGFNLVNPYAVQAAQTIVGDLVTNVSEEVIDAIRGAIAQSIENGIPPRNAARYISSVVGLNAPQARALENFRAGLVAKGIAQGQIDRMTASYGQRLLTQRGLMIARTETIRASVAGTQAGWQQAIADGNLNSQTLGQVWIDTDDESTCPTCLDLAGQDPVPFGSSFSDGSDGPPAHPNCRCDVGVADLPTPLEAAPASALSGDDSPEDLATEAEGDVEDAMPPDVAGAPDYLSMSPDQLESVGLSEDFASLPWSDQQDAFERAGIRGKDLPDPGVDTRYSITPDGVIPDDLLAVMRDSLRQVGNDYTRSVESWRRWGLSEFDRETIENYTGSGYRELAYELRLAKGDLSGLHPALRAEIERLDRLTSSSTFKEPSAMFHGAGNSETKAILQGLEGDQAVGATFTADGYVSVADTASAAASFGTNRVMFIIDLPVGSTGFPVAGGEREVILPRGQTFIITSYTAPADRLSDAIYHLEPVDMGAPADLGPGIEPNL